MKILNFESLKVHKENRIGIRNILHRLNLYVGNENVLNLMTEEKVLDLKIMYWAIKELYESPHKALLHKINEDNFKLRFLKAKKYMDYSNIENFIKYFMTCLQNELVA